MKVNIIDILDSLSRAQSVISTKIGRHQQQVAYLSYKMAEKMGWSQQDRDRVLMAGLWHDIGALSMNEKSAVITESLKDVNTHAFRGAYLVSGFLKEKRIAPIIKYHHFKWNYGQILQDYEDLTMESQLLHISDRVCSHIIDKKFVLSQVKDIKEYLKRTSGEFFVEEYVKIFLDMADNESLWLNLVDGDPIKNIDKDYIATIDMSIEDLADLAKIYSYLIDFRSPFTSTPSASVAIVAERLAQLLSFSHVDCKKMLIAGYLHDLGKLTIPNEILEKKGALEKEEYDRIRSHTYYTYHLLDGISVLGDIKLWAAYHHERLSGDGYPFHIGERDLPLGSRIMAVSDVFTALQEKRPYKPALSKQETIDILNTMIKNNILDAKVVRILVDNFDELANKCEKAKENVIKDYENLYKIV